MNIWGHLAEAKPTPRSAEFSEKLSTAVAVARQSWFDLASDHYARSTPGAADLSGIIRAGKRVK